MKKTIVVLALLVSAFFVFIKSWLNHPLPQYEGEKTLPVNERADVFTDEFGVPHIFAENEKDLFLQQVT